MIATKIATRIGVPALVLFIVAGMVLGSDISGVIYFDNAWLAQFVGTAALVIILFEGGMQVQWQRLRPVTLPAISLATVGVLGTSVLTALVVRLVLGVEWPLALLIGAIVGSTDAAAVFAVVGTQNIKRRMAATLEAESGTNDPMAIFLTILTLNWIIEGQPVVAQAVLLFLWQIGLGLLAGLASGWASIRILSRIRLAASGLYPILLFAIAFFSFASTAYLGGSGFVAVYVLGVYMGSVELPYHQSILRFHEGLAWMAQIVMFIILGLLVFPLQLVPIIPVALVVTAALMLVARPISVLVSTVFMGFSWREKVFLSWAGLRGAVPIVLATFPMVAEIPESGLIFNLVFFVVLTSALVQGSTIAPLASRLGLTEATPAAKTVSMELVTMEQVNAALIEITLTENSPVIGKELATLHLPPNVTVCAVLRAQDVVTPRGNTRLEAGDVVFVLANKDQCHLVRPIFEGTFETEEEAR